MRTTRAVLVSAAVLTGLLAPGALAADYSDYKGDVTARLIDDSLWLGHFSGGRNLAPGVEPIPLDWVDLKQDFASLRDCAHWVTSMTRSYSTYEGFKTCVRIR